MSLLGTIYTSMSGLAAASKGLDNLSNNVANINTPGYKANDIFFRALSGNGTGAGDSNANATTLDFGHGAEVGGSAVRFTQGDVSETGVLTDMAIEGEGLFILRDSSGNQFYTRAGQFRFDEDGYLVDPASGYRVAALNEDDEIIDINVNDFQTREFQQSTLLELEGALNALTTEGEVVPGDGESPIELDIVDENGATHTIELQFTKLSGNRWQIDFLSQNGSALQAPHIIEFNSLGSPLADTLEVALNFEDFEFLSDEQFSDAFTEIPRQLINDPLSIDLSGDDARLVIRDNGNIQFVDNVNLVLNSEGQITDSATGAVLAGRDADGNLADYNLSDVLDMPGQSTSTVTLNGVLNSTFTTPSPGTTDIIFPPTDQPALSLPVHNADGDIVDLTLRFKKETTSGDLWSVQVTDESDPANIITANVNRSLGFDSLGNLLNSTVDVSLDLASGETLSFALDFSGGADNSSLSLVDDTSTNSINLLQDNGFEAGTLADISIDSEGKTTLYYTNGQTSNSLDLAVVDPTGRNCQ